MVELADLRLDRTFEAIVFDWDGTAVPDREADASEVRQRVEALCAAGVQVLVVSGTHVGNIDGQLIARPTGPGHLHLCLNRGSEVFTVGPDGPVLTWRREVSAEEDQALDRAAALTVERLEAHGLEAEVVSQRINRRKIDLIPQPPGGERPESGEPGRADSSERAWLADPPKARIGELVVAVEQVIHGAGLRDLSEVVHLADDAARDAGLADPRITSDVKHVEIGLTDKSDSARWIAAWLADRGISGELILVLGDELGPLGGVPGSDSYLLTAGLERAVAASVGAEPAGCPPGVLHLPGGPASFLRILDAQLQRRQERRVPNIDADPAWTITLPADLHQHATESLATLSNGKVSSRGVLDEHDAGSLPLLVANGVYTPEPDAHLVAGPVWEQVAGVDSDHADPASVSRALDLRSGLLWRSGPGDFRSMRFVSAAEPTALALRAEWAHTGQSSPGTATDDADVACALTAPAGDPSTLAEHHRNEIEVCRVRALPSGGGIAVAAQDTVADTAAGERTTLERLGACVAHPRRPPRWDEARWALANHEAKGFDRLLAEHRTAWARLWTDAEVSIAGNPDDQLAARFAVFHLLGAAPADGEAAVGARTMSGPAYEGHVFWDADVFVLPVLAAINPSAARAMLTYRVRRLGTARAAAEAHGRQGARFPWESAGDGTDVTPDKVIAASGLPLEVHSGRRQEHIVADIAWAADRYASWSGDTAFLSGPGRTLVLDAARYWASRITAETDGRGHIRGVMGPDEYHAVVDDNAYTNVLARWTLRRAVDLADGGEPDRHGSAGRGNGNRPKAEAGEVAAWRELADVLTDSYDPAQGRHEQFAGYSLLEPLLASHVATPPFPADLMLGVDRVAGSQLIKQADVIMAHHVVPDEMGTGSLTADLDHYLPRTTHGSSLSPAIYAAQLARAGQPDQALPLWRLAARIDLDDITGTTAGGLHIAAMGGVWQALAYGFLGLRAAPEHLVVDPHLPQEWEAVRLRFRFRGRQVAVQAGHTNVTVTSSAPLLVRQGNGPAAECGPAGHTFAAVSSIEAERSQP